MPRRPEVLNAPVRNDEKFISMNTRPERGGSMSLRYFEDRESREKWIGKVEIVRIDPRTDLLDEKEIEGRAWHEKLASDIYDFYGVEVPRLELSKQQCHFDIRTYGFRSLPTVTHLMSKVVPNFSPYNHLPVLNPTEENLYLEVNRMRVKERGLGSVLAVALWINDIDVLGGSFNNIGYIIEERSEGRVAKTINIDFGYAFAGLAEGVTKEHIQTLEEQARRLNIRKVQGDSGVNIYLGVDCFSKNTKIEFSRTLWDILNTSDEEIEAFFQRREMPDWIHQRYQVLAPVLKYRRDTLREAYAEDIRPLLQSGVLEIPNERVEREPPVRKSLIERIEADIERRHGEADTQQLLASYISPDASSQPGSEVRFSFEGKIAEFIDHPQKKTMVIYGDSGAGKTLGSLELEKHLFEAYRRGRSSDIYRPIPLRIELNRFDQVTVHRCVYNTLRDTFHSSDEEIEALRQSQSIIFILDGYDEISGGCEGNLYETNQLEHWQAKIITTCRWQTGTKTRGICESPQIREHESCYLMPFTLEQVERYGRNWFDANQSLARGATWAEAQRLIEQVPDLATLIENPFLLTVFLGALPELLRQEGQRQANQTKDLTSWRLYAAFMKQWFEKDDLRQANQLLQTEQPLSEQFQMFSESLAWEIYANNIVEVTDRHAELWEQFFTNPEFERARIGCPLRRSGEHAYRFIHKSFLEYFVALNLWKLLIQETPQSKSVLLEKLNARFLVDEPEIIRFLVEALENIEFEIRQRYQSILLEIVLSSRDVPRNGKAASSAITVLNVSRYSFSGLNLSGINIPRANLSGSNFGLANLSRSDLTKVILSNAYLMYATLTNSMMQDVTFGVRLLEVKGKYPVYSIYKELLAAGCKDGCVYIIQLKSGRCCATFKGHANWVTSVAFTPDGNILASGSRDKTVRLWDMKNNKCYTVLACQDVVKHVEFSPDGRQLFASLEQEKISLWNVVSNGCQLVFERESHFGLYGQEDIHFSPDGQTLALPNKNAIDICNVNGSLRRVLYGHIGKIICIQFSPNGEFLISGALNDETVRLWNIIDGTNRILVKVNKPSTKCAHFSKDGRIVASASQDKIIYLWEVISGRCLTKLSGHTDHVHSVRFSPDNNVLTSGSFDNTIRLWSLEDNTCLAILDSSSGCFLQRGHLLIKNITIIVDFTDLSGLLINKLTKSWKNIRLGRIYEEIFFLGLHFDEKFLVAQKMENCIHIWLISRYTRHLLSTFPIDKISFSPDGQVYAVLNADSTISLRDIFKGNFCATLQEYRHKNMGAFRLNSLDHTSSLRFSLDSRLILIRIDTTDRIWGLWEVSSGRLLTKIKDFDQVKLSPDSRNVVLTKNGTVRLWNVENQTFCGLLKCNTEADGVTAMIRKFLNTPIVDFITFSPNSKTVAFTTRFDNKNLKLFFWKIESNEVLEILKLEGYSLTVETFSSDNRWAVVKQFVADFLYLHMYNIVQDTIVWSKRIYSGTSFCFSPDGQLLAMANNQETTISLWDMASCRSIEKAILQLTDNVIIIAFNKHNSLLIGLKNGAFQFWGTNTSDGIITWIMQWCTPPDELNAYECNIAKVEGLSLQNQFLLKQKGAKNNSMTRSILSERCAAPVEYQVNKSRQLQTPRVTSSAAQNTANGVRMTTLASRQRAQASSRALPPHSEHGASVSAAGMYSSSHRPVSRQQSSSDCCCVVL